MRFGKELRVLNFILSIYKKRKKKKIEIHESFPYKTSIALGYLCCQCYMIWKTYTKMIVHRDKGELWRNKRQWVYMIYDMRYIYIYICDMIFVTRFEI